MKKGFFLIEALLSVVVFSMIVLSLFSMVSFLQRRTVRSTFESDASLLVQDGMEIAHSALLSNWDGYADGFYYPVFNADPDAQTWILATGEEAGLEAIFNRKIEIKRVCRSTSVGGSGETIEFSGVCTGGEIDRNSKEITTTVWWMEQGLEKKIEAELLVININE